MGFRKPKKKSFGGHHLVMWVKQCHKPLMTGKHSTYIFMVMCGDGEFFVLATDRRNDFKRNDD